MANQPPPSMTAIIGPQYCAPATHSLDLIVTKERSMGNNFTIRDINDNIVFIVKSSPETFLATREDRFLYDANRNPILRLRRSLQTADDSWKAYRGESKEAKDYIFTRMGSSFMQQRTKLNVFLANNNTGVCDFTVVKADLFGQSWKVLIGKSDNVVAQINKKPRALFSREKFMVTICPNIDYAFIVALTVTLTSSSSSSNTSTFGTSSWSHGASSTF